MKRIGLIVWALTLAALLVLAGCSSGTAVSPTAIPTSTPQSTPQNTSVAFVRGHIDGNTFISGYGGITFTLPEDWTFASDEEIADLMDIGLDVLNDEQQFAAKLSKLYTIYEFTASNKASGESVSVMYENLSISAGNKEIDPELYAQMVQTQLEAIDSLPYKFTDTFEMDVCGQTYTVLPASIEGYSVYQYYLVRSIDKYMMVIIVTSVTDDGFETIMEQFS